MPVKKGYRQKPEHVRARADKLRGRKLPPEELAKRHKRSTYKFEGVPKKVIQNIVNREFYILEHGLEGRRAEAFDLDNDGIQEDEEADWNTWGGGANKSEYRNAIAEIDNENNPRKRISMIKKLYASLYVAGMKYMEKKYGKDKDAEDFGHGGRLFPSYRSATVRDTITRMGGFKELVERELEGKTKKEDDTEARRLSNRIYRGTMIRVTEPEDASEYQIFNIHPNQYRGRAFPRTPIGRESMFPLRTKKETALRLGRFDVDYSHPLTLVSSKDSTSYNKQAIKELEDKLKDCKPEDEKACKKLKKELEHLRREGK